MKERPILFSGEMVRAILEGRKTQTRRVLNPQPDDDCVWEGIEGVGYVPTIYMPMREDDLPARFPYGKVGGHLWVRETFLPDPPQDGTWDFYSYTDGVLHNFSAIPERYRTPELVLYKASWDGHDLKWLPSIHMPRWASRISLEITGVRVERVQAITANDALAEGISKTDHWKPKEVEGRPFDEKWWDDYEFWNRYPQIAYRNLWDKINGQRDSGWFGWDKNPWVWVIEFKRLAGAGESVS